MKIAYSLITTLQQWKKFFLNRHSDLLMRYHETFQLKLIETSLNTSPSPSSVPISFNFCVVGLAGSLDCKPMLPLLRKLGIVYSIEKCHFLGQYDNCRLSINGQTLNHCINARNIRVLFDYEIRQPLTCNSFGPSFFLIQALP